MAEPMGKLKSNLLLFALALGEERRAGQPPPAGGTAAVQVGAARPGHPATGCGDKSSSCPGVPSVPKTGGRRAARLLSPRTGKKKAGLCRGTGCASFAAQMRGGVWD